MSTEPDRAQTENPLTSSKAFVTQVARYYRDFLETDFKKSRAPARQVRIRDSNGNPLGFNVRRYPSLMRVIADCLAEPFVEEVTIPIKRGQYQQQVSQNVQLLMRSQIEGLDDTELRGVVNECVYSLKHRAEQGKADIDKYVDDAQELIAARIMGSIVGPLIESLQEVLKRSPSIRAEELLYEIEDDIAEHIVEAVRENIPDALVTLIQDDDVKPLAVLLNVAVGPEALKAFLSEFFSNLATSDAYDELLGLAGTLKIHETLQVYLYLMDLIIKPHQFPIAYIPIRLEKIADRFLLRLDNRLFFNRRALKYAADHDAGSGLRVPGKPTNDRIHFLFEASPRSYLEETVLALMDAYKLPDQLRPLLPELERSRSSQIEVTNAVHICAFEKGEEAIVNDYEEILIQSAQEESPLSVLFDNLINGCILEEPRSLRGEVESRWEQTPRDERLVYESPVPLNEEQRKLLISLQNDRCRYLVVEGPPGTGKSHTITAIVFDAIMRDRSVLVLSDKEEALDVVEDKLTQTLNAIRPSDDFQNPILRLGRTSGTYTKILKKGARDRIQTYYQAAKAHRRRAKERVERQTQQVKTDINKTVENLCSIDIGAVIDYERRVAALRLDNIEQLGITEDLCGAFAKSIEWLGGLDGEARKELAAIVAEAIERDLGVETRICQRLLEAEASQKSLKAIEALGQFEAVPLEQVGWLKTVMDELQEIRNPVFGYLFKRTEVRALAEQMDARMPLVGLQPPHKRRHALHSAATFLSMLKEAADKRGLDEQRLQESIDRLREGPVESALRDEHLELLRDVKVFREIGRVLIAAGWEEVPNLDTWICWKPELSRRAKDLKVVVDRYLELKASFLAVPSLDLQKTQAELQHEHTADLAHRLDKNVLDFVSGHSALSTTLKSLIRQRQPFPKDRFEELKKAFPCIIAGIREFADYIPLAPGLVDIVIIDEASQVSIAQAFPALLRAKQVVVLGDEQQFANVKTSTASRAVNSEYMYELEEVFRQNFEVDAEKLERMRSFDVRTSILRFFDLVKHFDVMLKKHFRGYSELISFSSRFFYDGQLQAIRIRARPVGEVLKFTVLGDDGLPPVTYRNANEAEVDFIHEELESLLV